MELKKNPKLDYRRYYVLFFNIGLVLSLTIVISAFEWKFEERISWVVLPDSEPYDQLMEVPISVHKPPKPSVISPQIVEIDDDKIAVDPIKYVIDIYDEPDDQHENFTSSDLPDEEIDKEFTIVEHMPSFNGGGQSEFLKYAMKQIKYPNKARRMGLEGKVFVQFVIDKDGKMTGIEVVRGIGGGCDAEVVRILEEAPNWTPGKQRGVPVKVRMILPVTFSLK